MTVICENPSSLFLRNSQQLKPIVSKLSRLDVNSTESNNRKTVITSKTNNKAYSTNRKFKLTKSSCRQLLLKKQESRNKISLIALIVFAVAVLMPKDALSAPTSTNDVKDDLNLIHQDSINSETPVGNRLKRENSDDDDKTSGLYDENDLEVGKRMLGNERTRRVSMMRLKKDMMPWQYPKRMSMMRLRRQYVPAYNNNRVTRGMGNFSMLRLRRAMAAPSLMRLKKMTQMRLKRMTQMRLKKSGVPQFEDEFEEDLGDVLSENKREAEEPAPLMISTPEEYDY